MSTYSKLEDQYHIMDGDSFGGQGSRTAILELWRRVFSENAAAVEGMQRGRNSPAYGSGVFSSLMDNPTHHFHQWVARKWLPKAASSESKLAV